MLLTIFLTLFASNILAEPVTTEILIEDYRDNFNGSRTVIGNSKNESAPSSNLKQTFNRFPGFDFVNNVLFFRGSESHQLLVVIDNIIVSDPTSPSNGFDFSKINFFEVETIELLTGTSTLKYGNKAFAGVLVITTKKRLKLGQELRVSETLGSYQTFNSNVTYEHKVNNDFSYAVTFNRNDKTVDSVAKAKAGETFEKDRVLKNSLSVKSEFNQGDNYYQLNVKGINGKEESDGGAYLDDTNFVINDETYFVGGEYLKAWNDNFSQDLNLTSSFTKKKMNNPDTNASYAYNDRYKGKRHDVKLDNSYSAETYDLSLGLNFSHEELKIDSNQRSNILPLKSVDESGIYLLADKQLSSAFNLAMAGSISKANLKNGSVSSSLKIYQDKFRFFSDHSINEKRPTIYQLFAPSYGNIKLKNEKLVKHSLGFDFTHFANDKITMSYFASRYTNLIDYDFVTSKYMNINQAKINGVEFNNNFHTKRVSLNSNATFMKAVNSRGEKLLRRPMFKFNHDFHLFFSDRVSGDLSYSYVGKRKDRVDLPAYYLVGAELKVSLKKDIFTSLKVNNLFNRDYEEIAGYFTEKRALYWNFSCAFL